MMTHIKLSRSAEQLLCRLRSHRKAVGVVQGGPVQAGAADDDGLAVHLGGAGQLVGAGGDVQHTACARSDVGVT